MIKKTLSKVLAVSLALILCFSALACGFVASADTTTTPTLTITLNEETYYKGDTVIATVTASGWVDVLAGAEFTVTGAPADATVALGDDIGDGQSAKKENGDIKFVNADSSSLKDGTLFTITFAAGDAGSTINLAIQDVIFCNNPEADVPVTASGASFKVSEKPQHEHSYSYQFDDNGHWQVCSNVDGLCDASTTATVPHSFSDGACVCGKIEVIVCEHENATKTVVLNEAKTVFTFTYTCPDCEETWNENINVGADYTGATLDTRKTIDPTNDISITDGQIILAAELFNEGQRPAVK